MSVFTQPIELPLWSALLLLAFVGGCGWLRGFAYGKGIKLP